MSEPTSPRATDACVFGDSLPALIAALELAEVGLRVRVVLGTDLNSTDLSNAEMAGWPVNAVRDHDGAIRALLQRLAKPISETGPATPAVLPVDVPPVPVAMRDKSGEWARVPQPSVFGIPAVPMSGETLAFLSGGAGFRAYLDRLKPLLTLGKTQNLDQLVRSRLGTTLLERLVEPFVRERFGADDVEVAIAAPGLNEKMSQVGALSAAVLAYADRNLEQETLVEPAGGWLGLRTALFERLALYRVEIVAEDKGEGSCEARALVVDAGGAIPREARDVIEPLLPERKRAHAVGAVVSATGPFADAPLAESAALTTVTLANGEVWSVRLTGGPEGQVHARAAGPSGAQASIAGVREDLADAGLELAAGVRVWLAAAPFCSLDDLHAAAQQLASVREEHTLTLPLGAALHGDDLAAAVQDAVDAAIVLRRRLVGIAD